MAKLTGNLEIDNEEGVVRVSVNPEMYSMNVIYGVAHSFTDRSYVLLDGDREIEIIVELKPFDSKEKLEEIGRKFNNRLLSYQVYEQKRVENAAIRQILLYRALMTNSPEGLVEEHKEEKKQKAVAKKSEKEFDIKDIVVPWKEKGKKTGKIKGK